MKIEYYHVPGKRTYVLMFAADKDALVPRNWVRVISHHTPQSVVDGDDVWEVPSENIRLFLKVNNYHTTTMVYLGETGTMKILSEEMYRTIVANQDTRNGVTNDTIEELRQGMLAATIDPKKILEICDMTPMRILETLLGEKMDRIQVQSVLNQPDGHFVGFDDFEKILTSLLKAEKRAMKRIKNTV